MSHTTKQEERIDVIALLSPESQARVEESREQVTAKLEGLSNPPGATLTSLTVSAILAERLQVGFFQLSELDTIFATVKQSLMLSMELLGEATMAYTAQQITQAGQANEA